MSWTFICTNLIMSGVLYISNRIDVVMISIPLHAVHLWFESPRRIKPKTITLVLTVSSLTMQH
jgi:hypothetical protein